MVEVYANLNLTYMPCILGRVNAYIQRVVQIILNTFMYVLSSTRLLLYHSGFPYLYILLYEILMSKILLY